MQRASTVVEIRPVLTGTVPVNWAPDSGDAGAYLVGYLSLEQFKLRPQLADAFSPVYHPNPSCTSGHQEHDLLKVTNSRSVFPLVSPPLAE